MFNHHKMHKTSPRMLKFIIRTKREINSAIYQIYAAKIKV